MGLKKATNNGTTVRRTAAVLAMLLALSGVQLITAPASAAATRAWVGVRGHTIFLAAHAPSAAGCAVLPAYDDWATMMTSYRFAVTTDFYVRYNRGSWAKKHSVTTLGPNNVLTSTGWKQGNGMWTVPKGPALQTWDGASYRTEVYAYSKVYNYVGNGWAHVETVDNWVVYGNDCYSTV